MVKLHDVAGMANSSLHPNSDLVDVGYDSILEAKEDMEARTKLYTKYDSLTLL